MKTHKLLVSVLILMFGLAVAKAGDAREFVSEKNLLHTEIESLFNNVPFDDILYRGECCKLDITFRINENRKLDDIVVEGENKALIQYVGVLLNNSKIKADPKLEGLKFNLSMKFVYKS